MGIPALPADPPQVAAYISDRSVELGRRPATLHSAAAAIAHIHRAAVLNNPCDNSDVSSALKSATRRSGKLQRQAEALNTEVFAEIRATACRPRRGGAVGRVVGAAKSRGKADIAKICLMPDAMLRVSETAAVKWEDFEVQADGTERLMIRRSRTDPEREGAIAVVSRLTIKSLNTMRNGATDSDRVIGLRPNQISRRVKQAAWAAQMKRLLCNIKDEVASTSALHTTLPPDRLSYYEAEYDALIAQGFAVNPATKRQDPSPSVDPNSRRPKTCLTVCTNTRPAS